MLVWPHAVAAASLSAGVQLAASVPYTHKPHENIRIVQRNFEPEILRCTSVMPVRPEGPWTTNSRIGPSLSSPVHIETRFRVSNCCVAPTVAPTVHPIDRPWREWQMLRCGEMRARTQSTLTGTPSAGSSLALSRASSARISLFGSAWSAAARTKASNAERRAGAGGRRAARA